jgi:ferritin-like metal-binding protein YciE
VTPNVGCAEGVTLLFGSDPGAVVWVHGGGVSEPKTNREEDMSERDTSDQLLRYLGDAHSIEEQALAQLRTAPDIAGEDRLAGALGEHLLETETHEQLVRERLRALGESPSRLKDMIMAVGGKGFVIFARSQPDTPGKLAAHAYSYEHLEIAAYELLARVARSAGDAETEAMAERIRADEQRMAKRLADLFDETVRASIALLDPRELQARLITYLADAHALEHQSIGLLQRAVDVAGAANLEAAYRAHLEESRGHLESIERRLDALDAEPSTVKDAAMRLAAVNWATFFKAHPDTPGKVAAFAYAFEHLEIGGYEQLLRVAELAGDGDTALLAQTTLAEERAAAAAIAAEWDSAAHAALVAVKAV